MGSLARGATFGVIDLCLLQAQAPSWARAKSADGGYGKSIAVDERGSVYVTGAFYSDILTFSSIALTNAGKRDIFVVKYDPNGQVLWAKSTGRNKSDYGYGIAVDARGNVYVTGAFGSDSLTLDAIKLTSAGKGGMLMGKLKP